MGTSLLLPIPAVHGHSSDLVAAYHDLHAASPNTPPNQPLLTINQGGSCTTVTTCLFILAKALKVMIQELELENTLYSLHSLMRGGATSAYRNGLRSVRHEVTFGQAMPSGLTLPLLVPTFHDWPWRWLQQQCFNSPILYQLIITHFLHITHIVHSFYTLPE